MAEPIVSVVIPLYNQGDYVRATIDGVQRSTLADVEIVVVEDGSTDPGTIEVASQLEVQGLRVIYQENKGLSAARNTGVRAARGRYILTLDADDSIDPTYLEKAVWLLERHPELGFVTTWVQCFGLSSERWKPHVTSNPHLWWLQNRAGPAIVFRRELWERAQGYDESLTAYEDWDFNLRLLEAGALPYQFPEPLFYYRVKEHSMYLDALARHEAQVERVRARHPGAAPEGGRGPQGFDLWALAHRLAETPTGRLARQHLWRDAEVLRTKGPGAWVRWRGFQAASRVPGAVATYRGARRALRSQTRGRTAENGITRSVPSLSVHPPRTTGVLFVVPWLMVGGADKVNLDLLRSLDRSRFHPIVVTTLGHDHPQLANFQQCTDEIFHLASLPSSDGDRLAFLEHVIQSRAVPLVQISNSQLGYELLPLLKARNRFRVVSLVHSHDSLARRDYVDTAAQADAWIDHHVAVSTHVTSLLVQKGVDREKVTTIVNGVDTERFAPGSSDWLREAGVEGSVVITFVGRLAKEKDPLMFAAAVEELLWRRRRRDVAVIVVGDGQLRDEVRSRFAGLRGISEVLLLGERPEHEVAEILRCTTVLVAPSIFEGLPIVGLEAMATGVPIVATHVPGWQDLIRDGVTGRLVARDPVQIAEAIGDLIADPEAAKAMGERARAVVLRDYSAKRMVQAYEALFDRLLLSPPSPAGDHLSSRLSSQPPQGSAALPIVRSPEQADVEDPDIGTSRARHR